MKLITKRLVLRTITKKDIDDLIENINNIKVARYTSTIPYPYSQKDAEWWIKECNKKAKDSYKFVIELKSEKKVIGGIDLLNVKKGKGEIGCWLGEKYWRKGIMSEASKKVLDFAFNKLKLRKVRWEALKENKGSNSMAKSLGFKKEGKLRKEHIPLATGKIHDSIIYSMLKEEWKKHRKKLK